MPLVHQNRNKKPMNGLEIEHVRFQHLLDHFRIITCRYEYLLCVEDNTIYSNELLEKHQTNSNLIQYKNKIRPNQTGKHSYNRLNEIRDSYNHKSNILFVNKVPQRGFWEVSKTR